MRYEVWFDMRELPLCVEWRMAPVYATQDREEAEEFVACPWSFNPEDRICMQLLGQFIIRDTLRPC